MSDVYTVEVVWEDGQWQASVRELPGAHTHAKTIAALQKRLREVIVLMAERPDSDVEDESAFTVTIVLPGDAEQPAPAGRPESGLRRAVELRRRAAEASTEAEQATRSAVASAQRAGISMRDTAALLGITHQRVHQIGSSSR